MFFAPLLAVCALGPMVINPDIADGETITKPRTIKVRVQSDSLVTQVEFYVDTDLRDSATSTPYTFQLDPLAEKDGPEKLTFTAYNQDGGKESKSVNVTIDSGASKGAAANTQAAKDLLTQSKWDDAIYAARVALKATPDYEPAQLILGHAFLGKGVYDKAQEFTEDALKTDPKSQEALELLSDIQLRHVFNSYASLGGDRESVIKAMGDAIGKAIDYRHKALDEQFDKLSSPTPSTAITYADIACQTGHYSAAISDLLPAFKASGLKTESGNRIGYAQLRLGRMDDLLGTLALMKAAGTLDGYSYALWAVADEYFGDTKGADSMIKEAIEQSPNNLGVQMAQVYIALQRKNLTTMSTLANSLANNQGQLPEVNFYVSILDNRLGKYEEADNAFHEAVLTEPLSFEMFVERGNEALERIKTKQETGDDLKYDLLLADRMYQAAREAKPDSPEALTATAISYMLQNKTEDARQMVEAATAAGPTYAAAHYASANFYATLQNSLAAEADKVKQDARNGIDTETQNKIDTLKKTSEDARKKSLEELALARKYDPIRLNGASMPQVIDVFDYFRDYGDLPVLTAPNAQ